jgi:hypothetical protein
MIPVPSSFSDPEILVTIALIAAGVGLAGAMAWIERKPRDLTPRLVPTTPVMFVGLLVAIIAAAHLLNLYGIQTGR